ncbi:GNAT family N-acetyltransferase [Clostridium cellulovorans]|uniref:GCN5-related N-acetyltransferase n=1 Tax=Clostridium cellulovorans (strain ATCC 35296 / DSM 3052 / OCM 3 / 743B) TaxID=573061 RepID=D9STY2_CLOC7|nr:GNAT family N-acetyltransferase [Clostridium cellulovorans]ADL50820.1 GCN5-related N-acetyltransferase [Clostridium cellulovorans 743B]
MCKVRSVTLEDKVSLVQLVKTMLGDENLEETAKLVVEDFFNNTQYKVFVIEELNIVNGFGVLKFESFEGANAVAEIVWLKVDDEHKRKGYGKTLILFMEQYAKENNIRKIYLKTGIDNKAAICFYIMQDYKFEARMLDFGCKGHDNYYFAKDI